MIFFLVFISSIVPHFALNLQTCKSLQSGVTLVSLSSSNMLPKHVNNHPPIHKPRTISTSRGQKEKSSI